MIVVWLYAGAWVGFLLISILNGVIKSPSLEKALAVVAAILGFAIPFIAVAVAIAIIVATLAARFFEWMAWTNV